MSWWISLCLAMTTLSTTDREPQSHLQELPPISQEDLEFIKKLEEPEKNNETKCSFRTDSPIPSTANEKHGKFLIFTSFSMPLESWKAHSILLQKIGGSFVLRGIPDNPFPSLSQKIQTLRDAGVHAEIILDPPAFEKYKIEAIPSMVLDDGKQYDKVAGNVDISYVLSLFAKAGGTQHAATGLLKKLEGR